MSKAMITDYIKAITYKAFNLAALYISAAVFTVADWLGFFDSVQEADT